MHILALEPYHGGSHRAFLDGWRDHSRNEFTILGFPPRTWKWRMRHAAVTLAAQVRLRSKQGERWDALFCSNMLNLAEFRGLCPASVAKLPSVAYFHENQLTYPVQAEDEQLAEKLAERSRLRDDLPRWSREIESLIDATAHLQWNVRGAELDAAVRPARL